MTARAHLIFVTRQYGRVSGGLGVSAERIVRHLRAEYDVTVLQELTTIPVGELHEIKRESDFTHFAFNTNGDDKSALQFISDTIIALAKEKKPAALCSFYGDSLAAAVAVTAKWIDTRFAVFLRGNDLDLEIFDPKSKLLSTFEFADRIFCVSRELENKVLLLKSTAKTVYIPNGVSTDVFEMREQRTENTRPVFGLLGDIKAKKGLSLILDALRFPEERLKIVGSLRPDQMKLLHGFMMVRGDTTEAIEVQAFTREPAELSTLYRSFDYVLIPSLHEGMPNVMLEAMSSGAIVIASNVAGMKDVIRDGDNGWLFDPWIEGDLARVITTARSMTKEEQGAMSLSARQTIEAQFTLRAERRLYLKEFEAFLRGPAKRIVDRSYRTTIIVPS